MPTPILDKAKTEELTTGELMVALRELAALNGAGSFSGIEIRQFNGRQLARIVWGHGNADAGRYCETVEDALGEQQAEILRAIAEEEELDRREAAEASGQFGVGA